jgi:hypothetical protein
MAIGRINRLNIGYFVQIAAGPPTDLASVVNGRQREACGARCRRAGAGLRASWSDGRLAVLYRA